MNAWWQGLNKRERNLVLVAAALVVLALGWMLVWKPLAQYKAFLQQDLQDAQEVRLQLQQQRAEILKLRGESSDQPVTAGSSLYTTVLGLLKQHQLDGEGTSSEEKDRDTVTLKLENKPFDPLIRLLAQVESRFAAHATSMTLKPAKEAGLVDAQITLQR